MHRARIYPADANEACLPGRLYSRGIALRNYANIPGFFRYLSTIASAVRYVRARMVGVGFAAPLLGNVDAPITKRLEMSQCCWCRLTTPRSGDADMMVPPWMCVDWERVTS